MNENEKFLEEAFNEGKESVSLNALSVATLNKEDLHKIIDECKPEDNLFIYLVHDGVRRYFKYVYLKR